MDKANTYRPSQEILKAINLRESFIDEIEIHDCSAHSLRSNEIYLEWIQQLKKYLIKTVGQAPILKLGAYQAGCEIISFDAYSATEHEVVAISIYTGKDLAMLPALIRTELELELPGVQAVFEFISSVIAGTDGSLTMT